MSMDRISYGESVTRVLDALEFLRKQCDQVGLNSMAGHINVALTACLDEYVEEKRNELERKLGGYAEKVLN
ncbi:MAG: hypothetical protein QM645_02060 [Asticcacaulis sp.]